MAQPWKILTDLDSGVWHDYFRVSSEDGQSLQGSAEWSIEKRTLRGGVSDRVDVVSLYNGALSVDILPTRGMGLWRGRYGGLQLGWDSPVRHPVHPSLVNQLSAAGTGWLTGFNEWMCRCGLSTVGEPGRDIIHRDGMRHERDVTLHGRIANTSCHHVSINVDEEVPGTLSVCGVMDEAWLYGPKLRLSSTVRTRAGSNSLTIIDEVTNLSAEPGELQLIYHTNLGRPWLGAGAKLVVPVEEIAPYDLHSAGAVEEWGDFQAPTDGYVQQCYFMRPLPDPHGVASVLLHDRDREHGIGLSFSVKELPCFTLWKNLQAEPDGYVVGIEPGTCFPNLKTFEREWQRVLTLRPGATYRTSLNIHVYTGEAELMAAEQSIRQRISREPTLHRHIHPRYSPVDARKV